MEELPERSHNNLRRSLDGSKVLLRWWSTDCECWFPTPETVDYAHYLDVESQVELEPTTPPDPHFIKTLETAEGPYTHEEILSILSTSEWHRDITNV